MSEAQDYDRIHLSPAEVCLYLGIERNELHDWLERHSIGLRYCSTPKALDHIMGWHYRFITRPPLDTHPAVRASIRGYAPAEPFGTADGSATTKYRPRPKTASHAARKGQSQPATDGRPQSQGPKARHTEPSPHRDRELRPAVRT